MNHFASWENLTDEQLEKDFIKDRNTLFVAGGLLLANLVYIAFSFWSI